MRTTWSLLYRGVSVQGGTETPDRDPRQRPPGEKPPGQRPPTQTPWTETSLDRNPPVDRQTPVKILPCPKLRLLAVTIVHAQQS